MARFNDVTKEHASITVALDGSAHAIAEAERGIRTAEAAVEQAKDAAADWLVQQSLGQEGARPTNVKEARAQLEDAQMHLETVRGMKTRLESEKRSAESRVTTARVVMADARSAAIKADPAVARLLADHETARRTAHDLEQALELIGERRLLLVGEERTWPTPTAARWRAR